jgi:hypothetical protein
MSIRDKASIQMARLSDLAEQIADVEAVAANEEDLAMLAKLRSERDRIHHNLKMSPMKVSA